MLLQSIKTQQCLATHMAQIMASEDGNSLISLEVSLQKDKTVLNKCRDFIVDNLDADDVIDELIQEKMLGRNAAQRVQLVGMTRVDKNRVIVDQLSIAGPGSLEKFCKIMKRNKRQKFIAEELQKCKLHACNFIYSIPYQKDAFTSHFIC